ncbi:hypothetical protein Drorol1_Dr00002037 [Drosera rotundifolia]
MTREGVPSSRSQKFYMVLASALALAFLEWLVTFMLFGNAVFAFFITQFARYFELPIPCLICSRLDHIFLGERVGFYGDLICRIHKVEISSLVFCQFHDKLVDVHEICEDCLCSFAADEEVNLRSCYCCDQRWRPRPQISSPVMSRSIDESEAAELDVPSFHEFNQIGNDVDSTNMSAKSALERDDVDSSSHFVYNELKVTSDTELEGYVDDKKDSMALVLDTRYSREITVEESIVIEPEIETVVVNSVSAMELEDKTLGEAFAEVGTIDMVSVSHKADSITYISAKNTTDDDIKVGAITMKPPIAIPDNDLHRGSLPEQGVVVFERETSSAAKQSDPSEDHYGLSAVESTSAIWHGLVELYSEADTVKVLHSPVPELIDINEMQEPSTTGDEDMAKRFLSLKLITTDNVLESPSSVDDSVGRIDNSLFYVAGTHEVEQAPVDEVGRLNESADAIDLKRKADPMRVGGDLSLLWSQVSSTRGFELPVRDSISPTMSANIDDQWKSYDPSASKSVEMKTEIQTLENDSISALEVEVKTLGENFAEVRTMDLVFVSDKVDSRTYISRTNTSDDDIKVEVITMEPPITTTDIDLDHAPSTEQGVLGFEREKSSTANQSEISEDHDGPSVMNSNSAVGHGLVELNWEADTVKVLHGPVSELIDINEMQESSTFGDEARVKPFPLPEHITTDNVPESSTSVDDSVEQSDNSVFYPAGTREVELAAVDEVEKLNELTTADAIDLNMKADPTEVSGDLRLLWSQLSFTRGFELPVKDSTSPRMSANVDDYWKAYEPSVSIGMQFSQKRTSLNRSGSNISLNGSSIESWDLSIVSEIEGESELDRLKRQAEHDRKLMTDVCKELEEERNASADAANQAMAMITRLQDEKAAVQIEALQDIRMMEEQVEFYVKALEKLNVLLEQKKKEIQELDAELRVYQQKLTNESLLQMTADTTDDASPAYFFASELGRNSDYLLPMITKTSSKDWLLEIDDERLYICRRLLNLEKKLQMCSNAGLCTDLPNEDGLEKEDVILPLSKMHMKESEVATEAERIEVLRETDCLESQGMRGSLVRWVHSFKGGHGSLGKKETDLVTLCDELSSLSDRLLALEEDRNFLEHAIYSLSNGDEGIRFIQEIAFDLRELRRIGVRRPQLLP